MALDVDAARRPPGAPGASEPEHPREALRRALGGAEPLLDLLLSPALDGAWVWTLAEQSGWVSPRLQAELGIDGGVGDGVLEAWHACVHPDDLPGLVEAIQTHLIDPATPIASTIRVRGAEGAYRWVEWRAVALPAPEGGPPRLVGIHTDVTELKAGELALAQANRDLRRRNQELERLAHVVSHDVRAPLRSIRGFGALLEEDHAAELSDDGQMYVSRIVGAAARLEAMLEGLLEYSRLSAAAREEAPVDLAELVAAIVEDLHADIAAVAGDIQVGDLPTVRGHAPELRSLIANLLHNALKYRDPARAPRISVRSEPHRAGYRVVIRDNGLGFDPELAERARGLFVQLHPRGEYEGTGLGLALADKVLERHDSALQIDTAVGQGTTMAFVLRPA